MGALAPIDVPYWAGPVWARAEPVPGGGDLLPGLRAECYQGYWEQARGPETLDNRSAPRQEQDLRQHTDTPGQPDESRTKPKAEEMHREGGVIARAGRPGSIHL